MCEDEEFYDPVKVKIYDRDVTYFDIGIKALSAFQLVSGNYTEILIGDYLVIVAVKEVLHHE